MIVTTLEMYYCMFSLSLIWSISKICLNDSCLTARTRDEPWNSFRNISHASFAVDASAIRSKMGLMGACWMRHNAFMSLFRFSRCRASSSPSMTRPFSTNSYKSCDLNRVLILRLQCAYPSPFNKGTHGWVKLTALKLEAILAQWAPYLHLWYHCRTFIGAEDHTISKAHKESTIFSGIVT